MAEAEQAIEETHTVTAAEMPGLSHGPVKGQRWLDTSGEAPVMRIYDGAAWKTLDEIVEQWWRDHFPNSVLSRAGSEVWNLAHAAKEDLKARLTRLTG